MWLLNSDECQVRRSVQAEHRDWFFVLVFDDQSQGVSVGRSNFQRVLHSLLQRRQ